MVKGRLDHVHIKLDWFLAPAEVETNRLADGFEVNIQPVGEVAYINQLDHVIAQIGRHVCLVHQRLYRHRVVGNIRALPRNFPLFRVQTDALSRETLDIVHDSRLIHGDQHLAGLATGCVTLFAQPDGKPSGKALNIGGKNILAVDRNSHLKEGTNEGGVGRLAARAVDRRHNNLEIVDNRLALRYRPWLTGSLNLRSHSALLLRLYSAAGALFMLCVLDSLTTHPRNIR